MALTFAAYVAPDGWLRPVAAAVVVVVALVNCAGVTRTALLTRVLVSLVLVALVVASVACFSGGSSSRAGRLGLAGPRALRRAAGGRAAVLRLRRLCPDRHARRGGARAGAGDPARDRDGAGRCGRGVRRRGGRRAARCSARPGPRRRPRRSRTPSARRRRPWAVGVVRVGAALASAGALLALVAGLGRTGLAMARERDLPGWLDAVHPRFRVPHRAELTRRGRRRGAGAHDRPARRDRLLVVRGAALLLRRQRRGVPQGTRARRFPRWLQLLGCTGCLVLVATLPWRSVVAGLAVFAVGIAVRWLRLRLRSARPAGMCPLHHVKW